MVCGLELVFIYSYCYCYIVFIFISGILCKDLKGWKFVMYIKIICYILWRIKGRVEIFG